MSACKGCGREIVWGVTLEGKKVPLEQNAHVYNGVYSALPMGPEFKVTRPPVPCFISHFLTCPQADRFSASKKREQTS